MGAEICNFHCNNRIKFGKMKSNIPRNVELRAEEIINTNRLRDILTQHNARIKEKLKIANKN